LKTGQETACGGFFKGGPYDFPCGAAGHFARGNTGFLPLDKMGAPSSDILSGGGASL